MEKITEGNRIIIKLSEVEYKLMFLALKDLNLKEDDSTTATDMGLKYFSSLQALIRDFSHNSIWEIENVSYTDENYPKQ